MDFSRFGFSCQKSLHKAITYSRSLGHAEVEVEHVALAMLRDGGIVLGDGRSQTLQGHLEAHLARRGRIFGAKSFKYGIRLMSALNKSLAEVTEGPIYAEVLWSKLVVESTVIRNFLGTKVAEKNFVERRKKPRDGSEPFKVVDKYNFNELSKDENESEPEETKDEEELRLSSEHEKTLDQYTVDLTALAERDELDPVFGRESETRHALEILGRKKKNNPILIGDPGVGKTAIAEALASRIQEGKVPESLKDQRVLSLDLSAMLAGAKFRGEFEERFKKLLEAIEACQGNIILFIDEVHMLVGAGGAEGTADAANMLKPALARGTLRCLGATTLDEYRKYIEKDAALERRFQPIQVDEPTSEATLSIMRSLKSHYEIHHGTKIEDSALVACVELSVRYLPDRRLPDKAIDLLDEACSRLRMQIESVPSVMEDLNAQIVNLEIERKAIGSEDSDKFALSSIDAKLEKIKDEYNEVKKIWQSHQVLIDQTRRDQEDKKELQKLLEDSKNRSDYDFAAKIQYSEIPEIDSKLRAKEKTLRDLQEKHLWLRQKIGAPEIAEVITRWTGVPTNQILENEYEKLFDLEQKIRSRVIGQDQAVQVLTRALKRSRIGLSDPTKPVGVFLFLGPTGVGKTETVKALTESLFGSESQMVRIDMSEYMESHSVARLVGAPPGYVGYGEGGELTEPVRRKPYSVVLFDEIEKAHPKVLDILLQLFDDGRLTDSKGQTVDFKNTIIVMTSNIFVDRGYGVNGESADDEYYRNQLRDYLRPEFIGRINEIVVFESLSRKHFNGLLDRLLDELNGRLLSHGLRVHLGEGLREELLKTADEGSFGGRVLKRAFENTVVTKVSDRIIDPKYEVRGAWIVDYTEDGQFVWKLDESEHRYLPETKSS